MKNLFTKKHLIFSAIMALLMVSCFKFTSVTLSTDSVMQEENIVLTAKLVNDFYGNDGQSDLNDLEDYGLFGIRVPIDWSSENPIYVNKPDGTEVQSEPSQFYTALLEYSFPKEGYKWLGFQTDKRKWNLSVDEIKHVVVTANLKSGLSMGDYQIDVVAGCTYEDTGEGIAKYYTINEDGSINVLNENTFPVNGLGLGQAKSELFMTGTLTKSEIDSANQSKVDKWDFHLADLKSPLNENMQASLDVRVTQNTSIETIAADEFKIVGDRGGMRVESKCAGLEGAVVTVFDARGIKVDKQVVSDGGALLKAHKGVCIVEVAKGNHKGIKKVVVR